MWVNGTCRLVHRVGFALDHKLPAGSLKHESSSNELHHECLDRACIEPSHRQLLTRRLYAQEHKLLRREVRMACRSVLQLLQELVGARSSSESTKKWLWTYASDVRLPDDLVEPAGIQRGYCRGGIQCKPVIVS